MCVSVVVVVVAVVSEKVERLVEEHEQESYKFVCVDEGILFLTNIFNFTDRKTLV